ncbi:hypothetical protein DFJ74DRAFT_742896 [Hyaloraphidium curvatum]|nr:hypothetical protein DFJ74DRAFT_742896 [Hyaloraphidium curvatum]
MAGAAPGERRRPAPRLPVLPLPPPFFLPPTPSPSPLPTPPLPIEAGDYFAPRQQAPLPPWLAHAHPLWAPAGHTPPVFGPARPASPFPPSPAAPSEPGRPAPPETCEHGGGVDGTCYSCLVGERPARSPSPKRTHRNAAAHPPRPILRTPGSSLTSLRSAASSVSFSSSVTEAWTWSADEYDRGAARPEFFADLGMTVPEDSASGVTLSGSPGRPEPPLPGDAPPPSQAQGQGDRKPRRRTSSLTLVQRAVGGLRGFQDALWGKAEALVGDAREGEGGRTDAG